MTNQQHLITPPPKLLKQWRDEAPTQFGLAREAYLTTHAAQWGADQRGAVNEAELQKARDEELEACCEWVRSMFSGHPTWADELRVARHPKPPTLKEQALQVLASAPLNADERALICQALEALPND